MSASFCWRWDRDSRRRIVTSCDSWYWTACETSISFTGEGTSWKAFSASSRQAHRYCSPSNGRLPNSQYIMANIEHKWKTTKGFFKLQYSSQKPDVRRELEDWKVARTPPSMPQTNHSHYLHANMSVTHHNRGQGEQTHTKQVIDIYTFYLVFTWFLPEKHCGPLLRSYKSIG